MLQHHPQWGRGAMQRGQRASKDLLGETRSEGWASVLTPLRSARASVAPFRPSPDPWVHSPLSSFMGWLARKPIFGFHTL